MATYKEPKVTFLETITRTLNGWRFNTKKQLAFLEDLHLLVKDGIPPNRAINMMCEIATGVNKDVALTISKKIGEGQTLADGMREWFSPSVSEIIRVGEEGGALSDTMGSTVKSLTQRSGVLSGLAGAILYPLLVILMASVMIVYLRGEVFVQFATIKPMTEWPDAGLFYVQVAEFIRGWWWLTIIMVIVSMIALKNIMNNYTGELRPLLDKFPPFSLYRQFVSAQFMESIGLLVANGVTFKNAIKVMQYQSSPYLTSHLVEMEHLLASGKGNIGDVLSTGLINPDLVLRLKVMAEVKGFEHGLTRMGVIGSERTTKTMHVIGKALGGVLLLVGGFLIIVLIRGLFITGMAMGSA